MVDLSDLRSPADLKALGVEKLQSLAEEIRSRIVSVCLKNGGHIGASLGTVDLAIALHRIFESPKDSIVWDVGHQAYAHKLLTGRADRFETLRLSGGLSGFLSRDESEHDVFGAGHSSTSLSAALGISFRNPNWTVAVIGDGGLTAGIAFEALNNVSSVESGPLLIVLNDNQMSISENVGGIHEILSHGRGEDFFGLFGLEYVGPIDGHDLPTLLGTLNGIRSSGGNRPILLHVMTQKGKGYAPAEARPSVFHGVGPAQSTPEKTKPANEKPSRTWSDLFAEDLIRLAEKDPKIVAITAAMSEGTGLAAFARRFPDRFFDVGIAEPHAVTFAAGLATQGWKPIVAIYSTFLQRGFDQMIHDVALQNLPVVFAVDRAGLVGADGPTHHGSFDLAYAQMIPNFRLLVPESSDDMKVLLEEALNGKGPALLRYPRGKAGEHVGQRVAGKDGWVPAANRCEKLVVTLGPIGARVSRLVEREGLSESVAQLHLLHAKPIDSGWAEKIRAADPKQVLVYEEGSALGGIGSTIALELSPIPVRAIAIPDDFIAHGSANDLESRIGFAENLILASLRPNGPA